MSSLALSVRSSRRMGIALFIVLLFVVGGIGAPILSPYAPNEISGDVWETMSAAHLFGTDGLGRDILSRMLFGARTTLIVAGSATVLAFVVGILPGFIAAVMGGMVDHALARLNDFIMSIPTLILSLVVLAIVPINLITLILLIATFESTRVFRLRALSRVT